MAQDVPDGFLLYAGGVGNGQFVVAVVTAIAETINTELAWIATGHHAHPSRNRDRGNNAAQLAVHSGSNNTANVRKIIEPAMKDQFWISAVQPDHHRLSFRRSAKKHPRSLS